MSDVWYGLCTDQWREAARVGLRAMRPDAKLLFLESARDIRTRVQESPQTVGAIVGPLDGGVSAVNVAAALARDHMAAEVVLAVTTMSEGLEARTRLAGIDCVIDLSTVDAGGLADLDEPSLCDDDVPTIVWGCFGASSVDEQRLPRVDPMGARLTGQMVPEESELLTEVQTPFAEPLVRTQEPIRVEEGSLRGLGLDALAPTKRNRLNAGPRSLAANRGPLIAFASGRGGVGKTSLVATMGTAAHRWGMRVALCDLDLWFGNLYSCFGMSGAADVGAACQGGASQQELLSCGRDIVPNLALWGPCTIPELAETVYPHVGELLDALCSHYELVLVDTSVSLTDAVAQAMQQCDRLVITVDGREGSGVAQSRLAALAVRLGVARTRIVRLANRCGPRGRGEPPINRADVGLETARPLRVLDGGGEVADCMGEGKVSDLFDLGSRFSDSASSALARLLSELGRLPDCREAQNALERRSERPRWGFGRRREVM